MAAERDDGAVTGAEQLRAPRRLEILIEVSQESVAAFQAMLAVLQERLHRVAAQADAPVIPAVESLRQSIASAQRLGFPADAIGHERPDRDREPRVADINTMSLEEWVCTVDRLLRDVER